MHNLDYGYLNYCHLHLRPLIPFAANKEESKVRKIAWISILFALYIAAALHATLPLAWELSVIVNHATSFADEVGALGHPPHWYLALTSPMELFTVFVGDCISVRKRYVTHVMEFSLTPYRYGDAGSSGEGVGYSS